MNTLHVQTLGFSSDLHMLMDDKPFPTVSGIDREPLVSP